MSESVSPFPLIGKGGGGGGEGRKKGVFIDFFKAPEDTEAAEEGPPFQVCLGQGLGKNNGGSEDAARVKEFSYRSFHFREFLCAGRKVRSIYT